MYNGCTKLKMTQANKITLVGFKQATLVNDILDLITEDGIPAEILTPADFLNNKFEAGSKFIIAVYKDPTLRRQLIDKLDHDQLARATFVHKTAVVSRLATIHPGTVISQFANVMINATVESDCHLAPYTMISHNSRLGQGSVMLPGAMIAGTTQVGRDCRLNMRSTVIDFLTVADGVEIGACSMLTKNATEPGIYVGTPARKRTAHEA